MRLELIRSPFGRTSNSRDSSTPGVQFGTPGAWRHSYSWWIDGSEQSDISNFAPTFYTVSFPDGRVIPFTYSSSDPYFRGPPGVQERFQPLDSNLRAYLILPDGEKIEFMASDDVSPGVLRPEGDESYCYVVMPMRL